MKKKDSDKIKLTREQKELSIFKIKKYIEENLDIEPGNLAAEMFVDFITEKIGPYFYNQGIADAAAALKEKVEDLYAYMKNEE